MASAFRRQRRNADTAPGLRALRGFVNDLTLTANYCSCDCANRRAHCRHGIFGAESRVLGVADPIPDSVSASKPDAAKRGRIACGYSAGFLSDFSDVYSLYLHVASRAFRG